MLSLRLSVSWFRHLEAARIMAMPPHPCRGSNDAAGIRKARLGAFPRWDALRSGVQTRANRERILGG
jgi:hypothetical protein